MIRRELAKDPKLAEESWDRFLPQFRKRHLKTSEKTSKKNDKLSAEKHGRAAAGLPEPSSSKPAKKVYTPFPPPQQPRKVMEPHDIVSSELMMNLRSIYNSNPENTSSKATRKKQGRRSAGNKKFVVVACSVAVS